MTTTVFMSGSRSINRLNDAIRQRLGTIVDKRLGVVVGDADGADKALQSYLAGVQYPHVTVFCSGDRCRNNLGSWSQSNVAVPARLTGRDFYAEKDKTMASLADYGFVLWDGKSPGSIGNVLELMRLGKPVVVYFAPEKEFHVIKTISDIERLLKGCDAQDYRAMDGKIHVGRQVEELRPRLQASFNL